MVGCLKSHEDRALVELISLSGICIQTGSYRHMNGTLAVG